MSYYLYKMFAYWFGWDNDEENTKNVQECYEEKMKKVENKIDKDLHDHEKTHLLDEPGLIEAFNKGRDAVEKFVKEKTEDTKYAVDETIEDKVKKVKKSIKQRKQLKDYNKYKKNKK